MSIFGDLDLDEVPNNPYFVPAGGYKAIVTEVEDTDDEETGETKHRIVFTIEDEGDQEGATVPMFLRTYPNLSREDYLALDPQAKRRVDGSLSRLKKTLIGDEETDVKGFALSRETVQASDFSLQALLGTRAEIVVRNNTRDGQQFSSVTAVEAMDAPF